MNAKTAEDIASLGEIIPLPRNFTGMTIFQRTQRGEFGKNSNRNRSGVPKGGWEIPRAAIEGARTCVKEARPLAFEVKLTTTSMPARIAGKI